MTYTLQSIDPKGFGGDMIFLYGDESAERTLPLNRRELAMVKERRERDRDFCLRFDRLPARLWFVSFDSEKPGFEVQEHLRCEAMKVVRGMEEEEVREVALTGVGTLPEELVAMLEGLTLADYSFDRYKSQGRAHLERVAVDSTFLRQEGLDALTRFWSRLKRCREWVNLPVQDFNAERFAEELATIAQDLEGVSCTVMDKRQIESLRMGGLLGVNRGSVDEPRFVVLEYDGAQPEGCAAGRPIVLVGKGIMYDTGGLNLKPEDYMQEMKSDMAGAATMASVLLAAADNKLRVHLVALLPLTDNRPGFNAYAADDILTMYDGTTVEVVNTDAEGRLILADAIAYAAKNYHPEVIIDAATLTGAAVRAISTFGIAAMQQGAQREMEMLKIVGEEVHERLVEFPMWSEYDEMIKSEVADLRNCGTTPQAGCITAGKFLAHFAGQVPFVHLDIAGVAYFTKPQQYYRAGATGYGMRLLYAFLQMQET